MIMTAAIMLIAVTLTNRATLYAKESRLYQINEQNSLFAG